MDRFRLFQAVDAPSVLELDGELSAPDRFLARLPTSAGSELYPELGPYEAIRSFLGTPAAGPGPMANKLPFEATRYRGAGPLAGRQPESQRIYDPDYLYPKAYVVRVRVVGAQAGDLCAWSATSTSAPLDGPCAAGVRVPVPARTTGAPGGMRTEVSATIRRGGASIGPIRTVISFPDRLVLALGESYASGEGNPDRPQRFLPGFTEAVSHFWRRTQDPYERWWRDDSVLAHVSPAQWWDPVCHRSLYSQHVAAAFIYSAARPREAVTFASFACSGAEMLSGVIAPQTLPPGISDFGRPGGDKAFQMTPQVEEALNLLCRNRLAAGLSRPNLAPLAAAVGLDKKRVAEIAQRGTVTDLRCEGGVPRPVDLVLLSVGGNDVGFSGAVKNALFPSQANDPVGLTVLAEVRSRLGVTPAYVAHRRIVYDLPRLYPETRKLIRAGLAPVAVPILQSSYPNPLFDQDGAFCDGPDDNRLFEAMHGLFPDSKVRAERRWRLGIDASEGRQVLDALFEPLNAAVRDNASAENWRVVEFGTAFDRRGWCAGDRVERKAYGLPGRLDYRWISFDPTTWDPYAPRTRVFRTANDVALTQIGSAEPLVTWRPLAKLGNRSFFATAGMFHPTAQAHTMMGLAVSAEMQRTLAPEPAEP